MIPLLSWKKSCLFPCSICPHLSHQLIWSLPQSHWWLHSLAPRIRIKSHHHPGWPQRLWRDSSNSCSQSSLTTSSQIPLISSLLNHPSPGLKSGLLTKDEMIRQRGPDSNHTLSSFPLSLACLHHTCSWIFASPPTSNFLNFLPTHHSYSVFPFISFQVSPCEQSFLTTIFLYSQWPCLRILWLSPPGKVPNQG